MNNGKELQCCGTPCDDKLDQAFWNTRWETGETRWDNGEASLAITT
ncbi:hypothetical protein ACVWYG_002699 [Pedobacter sp. UYEF25]